MMIMMMVMVLMIVSVVLAVVSVVFAAATDYREHSWCYQKTHVIRMIKLCTRDNDEESRGSWENRGIDTGSKRALEGFSGTWLQLK